MIEVKNIKVRGLSLDDMEISWEVGDYSGTASGIQRYQFFVNRSESPTGPFVKVGGPFVDTYSFRDVSPALLHQWRLLFYQIQVKDLEDGKDYFFGPNAQIPEPDLTAIEAARLKRVLYRQHKGRAVWLYPIRTFGPRCFCWDKVTKQRTRSNCINCFDTGFLGGYLSPTIVYAHITPSSGAESETLYGRDQSQNVQAKLPSFPFTKPGDMIVEAENHRWRVAQSQDSELGRAIFEQTALLHAITKGDISYKVPVNAVNLTTVQPRELRNYTNPQHADLKISLSDIFGSYGFKP